MCCTTLRGVAFFGASVHIAVGFILFSRYVIATVVFTFYNFNNLFSEKVTAFLAPFMVYVTLLLALGILIFHSVEKECFVLLKWSSVAFSLLQLAVFIAILVLKLAPNYEYHRFPFLPESLVTGYTTIQSGSPALPEVYIAVPHGTTVEEKDLLIRPSSKSPSSDPPDPGGAPGVIYPTSNTHPQRDGVLQEIYRLTILICCVLLTLVYLLFLFLYIRQLNDEDTGHVFGHAQAITRNIAFYVQPQFTSNPQQGTQDNNSGQPVLVQRSQTQIPQQFLPQQSPKKPNQIQPPPHPQSHPQQTQQIQPHHHHPPSLSVDGSGSNPEVQRSPKRRPSSQQSALQGQGQGPQGYSPRRSLPHLQTINEGGVLSSAAPLPIHQHHHRQHPQLPIMGPSGGRGGGPSQGHPYLRQPPHTLPMRGPIPAQVRIGFYPQDLRGGQSQDPGMGISPQNIRPRGGPLPFISEVPEEMMVPGGGGGGGRPMMGPYLHVHHHQQQQFIQHRVQFQQHSAYPSDSSSSIAYSPNPPMRGVLHPRHPISMV